MRSHLSLLVSLLTLSTVTGCAPDSNESGPSLDGSTHDPDPVEDTGEFDMGDADTGETDTGDPDPGDGEDAEPTWPSPPDADAFASLGVSARDALTQIHVVDPAAWTTVVGDLGTSVFIAPDSMAFADGTRPDGPVDLELIEVFDKGSMLVTNMPSIARAPSGDVVQLISGGEHYISATSYGEPLRLTTGIQLNVPTEATGGADPAMTLFRARTDTESEPGWSEEMSSQAGTPAGRDDEALWVEEDPERVGVRIIQGGDAAGTQYHTISSAFGWTNIDRWYSDPRPKTSIHVTVPEGWDDSNSEVYLSYDGEPTALARMDVYDAETGRFTEHYGQIPVGLEVHIIFVTEDDGQWSYAIQGATIEEDHVTSFDAPEALIQADTESLIDAINQLP